MVQVDGHGATSSLIQVRGLDKKYKRGSEEIHVLQGLNLDVDQGEFVAFMGPSGSGKTTLLNLLGGLDVPSAGSIVVSGDEITHMSRGKLTEWRARHVGFIFQMYNLIPVLTAYQNVELPLLLTKLSGAERRKHVETALGLVGLADRMRHYPRQLSGGQEQRVAIARLSAPSSPIPRSCSATSRPAISTARARMRSWLSSSVSSGNIAKPS